MITIRVICPRSHVPSVLADLGTAFTIKDSCQYPARTPGHVRLYVDATPAPARHPRTKTATTRSTAAN
ncbi:hypothetical protein AB0I84_34570 [Streptomyces spectabilis]|uniref:hypothetical protein n=1 Tax=Streptomyces spectabilis TaxID=68270 RepID=UPI0033F68050